MKKLIVIEEAYKEGLLAGRLDKKLGNSFDPDDRNHYALTDLRRGAFEKGYKKGYYS